MYITDMKVYMVDGSYSKSIGRNYVLVKLETDEGIYGIGEGTTWPGGKIVKAAMEYVKSYIIGKDPFQIESVWSDLYNRMNHSGMAGFFVCALSGIEMALWDIVGKKLKTPVYNLLGGRCRDKIPVYANYWYKGIPEEPEIYKEKALEVKENGYQMLKMCPFFGYERGMPVTSPEMKKALKLVEAVREAVGPDFGIAIECAALFDNNTVYEGVKLLGQFNPVWLEEPLPPENVDAMAKLRDRTAAPIAVGERLYTRYGFRETIEKQAVSFIQPDLARTGGILETKKIASMAEIYYIPVTPHNPNGPVCTAATLQLTATIPNLYNVEFLYKDEPWRNTIIAPPIIVKDGYIELSDRPGLGIEFDEKEAEAHPAIESIPLKA